MTQHKNMKNNIKNMTPILTFHQARAVNFTQIFSHINGSEIKIQCLLQICIIILLTCLLLLS